MKRSFRRAFNTRRRKGPNAHAAKEEKLAIMEITIQEQKLSVIDRSEGVWL